MISTTTTHRRIGTIVADQPVWIEATVEDTVNTETGDSVVSVSVDTITTMKDGQMIATKTLSAEEFRALVRAIRRQEALT